MIPISRESFLEPYWAAPNIADLYASQLLAYRYISKSNRPIHWRDLKHSHHFWSDLQRSFPLPTVYWDFTAVECNFNRTYKFVCDRRFYFGTSFFCIMNNEMKSRVSTRVNGWNVISRVENMLPLTLFTSVCPITYIQFPDLDYPVNNGAE